MLDLLCRKSNCGDLEVNLAMRHLASHEWGRARMTLERALAKGGYLSRRRPCLCCRKSVIAWASWVQKALIETIALRVRRQVTGSISQSSTRELPMNRNPIPGLLGIAFGTVLAAANVLWPPQPITNSATAGKVAAALDTITAGLVGVVGVAAGIWQVAHRSSSMVTRPSDGQYLQDTDSHCPAQQSRCRRTEPH